ncbi:MAG: methyltransferase domain-containing protein [Alphaproteobacteria bacterium]|nr:methyltransferase domain-containing protein [Alphaproteobacteria bacterium]
MSEAQLATSQKKQRPHDAALFFRRWLSNPLQMGSIIPSSPKLGALIAKQIDKRSSSLILELGAGTGAITKSLISAGISPGRIVVVEIVPEMADHLRAKFSQTSVLQADAFNLPIQSLKDTGTEIGTVICGIPLVLLNEAKQRQFIQQVEAVAPGRGFLLYTYCVTSPLPHRTLGLDAQRLDWTPLNFPPASVWHYRPKK